MTHPRALLAVSGLCLFACAAGSLPALGFGSPDDTALLCKTYFQFLVDQQVQAQAHTLAQSAVPEDRKQVEAAAAAWYAKRMTAIRDSLQQRFGAESRGRFEQFVSLYTSAEKGNDPAFLGTLASALKLAPAPDGYAALRQAVTGSLLASDVNEASKWLSEVQTWLDVRTKLKDTPALEAWLTRSEPVEVAKGWQWKKTTPAAQPVNPLASAEPEMGQMEGPAEDGASPLDTFDELRSKKRQKALEEAQAGMQQVAAERQAAEEEYGQKKLAAAQAEAENIKRHAEKLAAVEKEALDQRQNSWSQRLKGIVGATITAATGAFTGGIGTRAGQEAANALFRDHGGGDGDD